MAEPINAITSQITPNVLGDDLIGQIQPAPLQGPAAPGIERPGFSGNAFEDILNSSIDSLNRVSSDENRVNDMINGYLKGEVELHEVLVAQAKVGVVIQLALTTINTAVQSFKEITQLQV